MRIAIIGAGGVGGYFGALLARAGHDVVLYARGENLAAIRADGITITDANGSFTVPIGATNAADELSGAEFAIVAVKSYSLGEVAPVARDLALNGSVVVPLLNGVEAADDRARWSSARTAARRPDQRQRVQVGTRRDSASVVAGAHSRWRAGRRAVGTSDAPCRGIARG